MRIFSTLLLLCLAASANAQTGVGAVNTIVRDQNGRPVLDAVVIAVPADGSLRPTASRAADGARKSTSVDKEFMPKVMVVLAGSAVFFPNHDNVRHQVYSFSAPKRFELPLYEGKRAEPVVFDKAGVVVLGCNIHDWMVGYVYVSESPWYAKTDAEGRAVIADLPPRAYVVRVWHPRLEDSEDSTRKQVDLGRGQRAELAWAVRLKPDVKIRRAPVAGRAGRY